MTPLDYILSCLRRAADNSYPWSLTPIEAGALVDEVERLQVGLLDIEQIVRDGMGVARAVGRDEERAAVVAWLRGEADAATEMRFDFRAVDENVAAGSIERGEHREEKE